MKYTCMIAFMMVFGHVSGQNVDKAKEILDKLSAKTKTYKTVETTFSFILENKEDETREVQEGSLVTKSDQYNLLLGGQQVISDGKTVWTHLTEIGEVTISNVPTAEEQEEEDYVSPTTIFTLYEKGFRYKFVKEETVSGKTLQLINLFPSQPDEKSFHTIRLYIDKGKQEIHKLKILGKDGTTYTYEIKTFLTNKNVPDTKFTFNKLAYPDVTITDLRE